MTKEQWLKTRAEEDLSIGTIFTFYKEMGGYLIDIVEFQKYLWDVCLRPSVIVDNSFKRVTHETVVHKIHKHYDKKFELCST